MPPETFLHQSEYRPPPVLLQMHLLQIPDGHPQTLSDSLPAYTQDLQLLLKEPPRHISRQ